MLKNDELDLVNRAQNGSEAAFEELVSRNEKLVYGLCLKLTGNPDDALDMAQESFIKAYTKLSGFRGESRFSVWLYRLTYNTCLDFLKKSKQTVVMSLSSEEDDTEFDIPDTSTSPEIQVEQKDLRSALRTAINELPEDKREIIVLREFSDMSYTDIAELLGINEGTVKSRLSRARQSLAEILIKNGTFPETAASKLKKGGKNDD